MNGADDRDVNRLPIDSRALWEGCILASCVHGVMLSEYPFTLHEHKWSGGLYITENSEGKAALIFSEEKMLLLGMFRDFSSERNELVITEQYAVSHYREAPGDMQEMVRTLALLFMEGEEGKELPYVTTGLWREDGQIYSRDEEEDWFTHGGRILRYQMMPFEEAMSHYAEICSMDERRMETAERIWRERIGSVREQVVLTREETELLREQGPDNMDLCREVFAQFGIVFEEED